MSKEAKIKKFKYTFLKPKHPDKEALKLKTALEKAARGLVKSRSDTHRLNFENASMKFSDSTREDYKEYGTELLSYKLTKHWDDDAEFKTWRSFGNPKTLGKAVEKMLAKDPSDDFIRQCVDRFQGEGPTILACFQKNPGLVANHVISTILTKGPDKSPAINTCLELCSNVVRDLFLQDKTDFIPMLYRRDVTPSDAVAMAAHNPRAYCKIFLDPKRTTEDRAAALKHPNVRKELAKDKELWTQLKVDFPMLGFFEEAEKKVNKTGTQKDQELSLTECVFDELLRSGNALNLTYFASNFTRPDDALAASPSEKTQLIAEATKFLEKIGYDAKTEVPKQPAAQCDVLVSMLTRLIEASLGPGAVVKCKPIVIPEMVLTVPLTELPGPGGEAGKGGLLPRDFGGNVYEDGAETPNHQVFFSGNGVESPDAHTYLDVDGVLYDAVLGTKGEDVLKAVAEKFVNWENGWFSKTDPPSPLKVAKGDKGNWIIQDPSLKAPTNSFGFKSAYRITKDISAYAVKKED